MTDRELLQQALEALETADEFDFWLKQESIVKTLRERLVQPEQEPVAWMHTMIADVVLGHCPADLNRHPERWKPLYATPPAAQPTLFGPMGTVGDLFDKHVIANGNLKKEWIVYLEKNT